MDTETAQAPLKEALPTTAEVGSGGDVVVSQEVDFKDLIPLEGPIATDQAAQVHLQVEIRDVLRTVVGFLESMEFLMKESNRAQARAEVLLKKIARN